jgi:hypothetical protein
LLRMQRQNNPALEANAQFRAASSGIHDATEMTMRPPATTDGTWKDRLCSGLWLSSGIRPKARHMLAQVTRDTNFLSHHAGSEPEGNLFSRGRVT